ncbi:Alcohol dehydrogenase-like protein [Paramyrothecium foliicola]|nr:Alcohol dehydrogenase-like protein [Paramyrothecium foliicola]
MTSIPDTSTSLVLPALKEALGLVKSPVEAPGNGTVLVRILCTTIRTHNRAGFNGQSPLSITTPYTPGFSAIARVIAAGPDAAVLRPGQLVYVDVLVRARDDPDATQILLGGHQGFTEGTRKLFQAWKGLWSDVAAVQMETCIPLDEEYMTRAGYSFGDLMHIERLAVANAGVHAADLRPGETVIVCPATGQYSGATAELVAQLGCNVIALSRSASKLDRLASIHPRITVVETTGDVAVDTAAILAACPPGSKGADALVDVTPGTATGTAGHLTSALNALRPEARVAMIGSLGDITLNYVSLMMRNINVRFRFMYSRGELVSLIRQIEAGVVKLGKEAGHQVEGYKLEDWEAAILAAEEAAGWGQQVVFEP